MLDRFDVRILARLDLGPCGFDELVKHAGLSRKTVWRKLNRLKGNTPPLVKKDHGKRGKWRITKNGRRALRNALRGEENEVLYAYVRGFLADDTWKSKPPKNARRALFYLESGLHLILGVLIGDILSGGKSSEECIDMLFRDDKIREILKLMFDSVEKARKDLDENDTMYALSRTLMYPVISAFLIELGRYLETGKLSCKEFRRLIRSVAKELSNIHQPKSSAALLS